MVRETLRRIPDGLPRGFCFFPDVHPEEAVAYEVVATALSRAVGR